MKYVVVNDSNTLNECFELRKAVFVKEQGVPIALEIDEFEDIATHLAIIKNDEMIATLRYRLFDGYAKVERVCVAHHERGKHVGQMIMSFVYEEVRKKGIKKLVLSAQTHAIPFYEKLGYVITSDQFLDANIPHYMMALNITEPFPKGS